MLNPKIEWHLKGIWFLSCQFCIACIPFFQKCLYADLFYGLCCHFACLTEELLFCEYKVTWGLLSHLRMIQIS